MIPGTVRKARSVQRAACCSEGGSIAVMPYQAANNSIR